MQFFKLLPFLFSICSVTLAQDFCSAAGGNSGEKVSVNGNKTGKIGGIDYEQWADGGNNNADFYADGSFSCNFQNSKDYLCRSGVSFPTAKTPDEIGHIKAEFKLEKQNAQNVGYSYVGVYGWTLNSGISGVFEYYIVDNWLSQGRPGDWVGNEKKGDFTIDGGEYTVYKNTKGNLVQFFSLRKTPRTCGTIDVTAHFDQWAKIGMKMGKISEIKVLAEAGNTGGGCSGTVKFPYAKVYYGDSAAGGNAGGNAGANPGNNQPGNNQPGNNQPGNNQPVNNQPVNNQPVNNQPVNNQPVNNQPVNNQPVNNQPVNNGGNAGGSCLPTVLNQGYKCCSDSKCLVVYVDDAYWGVENGQWCGCGTAPPKCVAKDGYPCCEKTSTVVETTTSNNEQIKWGVEDAHWCYIK